MDLTGKELRKLAETPARLPVSYQDAKTALATCVQVDECKDWADKAEAIASYAKQAHDDTLRKLMDRIQVRAIRRAGELLKTFDARGGDRSKKGVTPLSGRVEVGHQAGLSEDQVKTAVRVANVPEEDFEEQVESDDPPTVTEMAEQGKKTRPLVDLEGIPAKDYTRATILQGMLHGLSDYVKRYEPGQIAAAFKVHEAKEAKEQVEAISRWLKGFVAGLREEDR